MNRWSRRRKMIVLFLVLFVLVVLIAAPIFLFFYRAPTCNDGKLNGDETGTDCGGSCQLLCSAESLPLILKGDPRVLEVTTNTFEVVALIQNSNTSGEIYRAGYIFKLYDTGSIIPIKMIEGETYIPKGATIALFEGPFVLDEGVVPSRATLEWKQESLIWKRTTLEVPELIAKDLVLSRENTSPRLDAMVENISLGNVSNIDLVALIYNETGSIIAASKTFIDTLPAGSRAPVVFSWPKPFGERAFGTDIIIRIFPDRSFIR